MSKSSDMELKLLPILKKFKNDKNFNFRKNYIRGLVAIINSLSKEINSNEIEGLFALIKDPIFDV